jgi:hypothetical protein
VEGEADDFITENSAPSAVTAAIKTTNISIFQQLILKE